MKSVTKYALLIIGLNILAFMICLALGEWYATGLETGLILIIIVPAALLFIQLVLGIIFTAGTKWKNLGKGMLIAIGIIFLAGLSLCSLATIL
jgi:hypothetical protein